jgi:L-asparaginase II
MSESLVVECLRGGARESIHPFSAMMVEDERVRWSVGEDISTFWRSASKPFQLMNSFSFLPGATVSDLLDEEIAMGAASHSGQPQHVAVVEKLLSCFDLNSSQLQCGAHPPMHEPSAKRVETPTALHNNCSGKHTFMLAACVAQGWALDYRGPMHPLQLGNQQLLDELGHTKHQLGIDGCSVPTFFAPLSSMAGAWSFLSQCMASEAPSPLKRIGEAMHRKPFYMSGDDRLDLSVVQQAREPLTVKVGAEGLFCIARPKTKQGIAIKIHSGNSDALAVAVWHVLNHLGVRFEGECAWALVKNVRGATVGERRVL